MHGVQTQRVHVIFDQPVQRVVVRPAPHLIAAAAVVVHRAAPRRAVDVGEVGAELVQVVPLRTHVIVHDVQHDADAKPVRGIHETLETVRSAVRLLRRVQVHAVVAPVPATGKGRHRHQLHRGDPQRAQLRQPCRRGVEGARRRERADVHLVDHEVGQCDTRPSLVAPLERVGIDHLGEAVHAVGLRATHRVGEWIVVVHAEAIAIARAHAGHARDVHAGFAFARRHRILAAGLASRQVNGDALRRRRPHPETRALVSHRRAATQPPRRAPHELRSRLQFHHGHVPTAEAASSRRTPPGGSSLNQRKSRELSVSR